MSFSYNSIIDEALRVANMTGGDSNASPVIDNPAVLEDLFYSALRKAVLEGSDDPSEMGGLKKDHTVTITSGVGTIPDSVLDELLDGSTVYSDDGELNGLMSFQPRYFDYIREGYAQLGYYAIQGTQIFVKGPGDDIDTYTGDVHLVATTVPVVVAAGDPLDISTETAKRTVNILADMLRAK